MLELIGRYQVQEKIGEGAMADVYRAYDPSIRRSLAIKLLKAQYGQDEEYASRFLREAKAAGALSHPNIVTIYDVGEVDAHPYIVMELLDGQPLNELMGSAGALDPSRVMDIAQQLAAALSYAHGVGVIHRDIKPSNIMISKDADLIKILDFGIARVNEAEGLLDADHLKTRIGQVLGTPRYMSPEQALGQEIDGRSDLFSVGVVMYEMLAGKKAFGGASAATLALQITQQDPEALSVVSPGTPSGLQFIVEKLLAKRPERRFSDGRALGEALRRERASVETAEAEARSRQYLPLQVRVTALMAATTAAVLALTIGVVIVRQEQVMRRMAITSGTAVTSFVAGNAALKAADNAGLPVDRQDWLPVQAFVEAASKDQNVLDVKVVDGTGTIRSAVDPKLIGSAYVAPVHEPAEFSQGTIRVSSFTDPKGRQGFRFIEPITYAGRSFGNVDLSLSKAELLSASSLTAWLMAMLGIVVLGAVAVATYVALRTIARPLRRLKKAIDDATSGDFNFRLSHKRTDEFGELFDAFNQLTARMQERLQGAEPYLPAPTLLDREEILDPPTVAEAAPSQEDPDAPTSAPASAPTSLGSLDETGSSTGSSEASPFAKPGTRRRSKTPKSIGEATPAPPKAEPPHDDDRTIIEAHHDKTD